MPLTVLGLGSNLGDREQNLAGALDRLEKQCEVKGLSRVYETTPFDVRSAQDNYLNCCVLARTELSPQALLLLCHEIEQELGRVRLEYHGARTMDVDILLYEGVALRTPELTIPHAGLMQRAFVLVPLLDLFPQGAALGLDFSTAVKKLDLSQVWLYK